MREGGRDRRSPRAVHHARPLLTQRLLRRQFVLLAGEPFQDDDAGVVLELVDLVSDASAHEAPHGFGGGVADGCGGGDEVGEASFAEARW